MADAPIKTEPSASPPELAAFSFDFHAALLARTPSQPPTAPFYRFGSARPPMSWPSVETSQPAPAMPFPDYDDGDLPDNQSALPGFPGPSAGPAGEKAIRRRSSKACDQCRKSKCKCERSSPGEPCKSCIMLGTQCTFLGPSRKRGPPKGYIDAIEARLHQTEALLGIMISAGDSRAQSLLSDISKDPLAKEIISRVDNSPYGAKGRKRDDSSNQNPYSSDSSLSAQPRPEAATKVDLTSTHPSNEWQDRVVHMLHSQPRRSPSEPGDSRSGRPVLRVNPNGAAITSDHRLSPARRQRRRVDNDDYHHPATSRTPRDDHPPRSQYSLSPMTTSVVHPERHDADRRRSISPTDSLTSASEDELTGAVGQLSLNEDEQVRYHGKASGLHLLGTKGQVGRNEGGIWRFPKARVWPPLPSGSTHMGGEDEFVSQLPEPAVQEHLVDMYFTYVHPSFPVVHKRAFFDVFKTGDDSPHSPESDAQSNTSASPFTRRRRRIPTILLLAMYALAARYSDNSTPQPSDASLMWVAGDEYLDRAKVILDGSYASSQSSTCQALLLMGYREIGIGAMAQAWTYIGMAIRMAQDLGMHRSADGWARVDLGGRLFGEWELHERKRIWYACVIMDKYVSTYIGRPLMIFERDFDTPLPSEDDPEEMEPWQPHRSQGQNDEQVAAVPGRIISCFNASATLSGILSMIVQAIYAVRPVSSRHDDSIFLEGLLSKWYIELPEHLRYDPGSSKLPTPLPHVLTLHMQYWCAVLLLHRPFIRHIHTAKAKHSDDPDTEMRTVAEKSHELCAGAANHITSIASIYLEKYRLNRCAVFLCYYIFTASIMHVTNLTEHPADPQARMGLTKCMDALKMMEIVWPSAGRALELLRGSKVYMDATEPATLANPPSRLKRSADQPLDDSFDHRQLTSQHDVYIPLRSTYATPPPHYQQHTHSSSAGGFELSQSAYAPSAPNMLPSGPMQYYSSYDRWPSNSDNLFTGTLSTSVLPQLYSTGLGDVDRGPATRLPTNTDPIGQVQRYPQYWNDYSAFPQLGTAYGSLHEPEPPAQQIPASQMYLSEQFNVYNR